MKKSIFTFLIAALLSACTTSMETETPQYGDPQVFLDSYNQEYQDLLRKSAEAEWKLNTRIVDGDTVSAWEARQANEAYATFTGSKINIETAQYFLGRRDSITPLQVKQFETILYMAGANPETAAEVVKERIKASTEQTKALYGYTFMLDGKEVTPNQIDSILRNSKDLNERERAWEASKEVGKVLKDGLVRLRDLRNESVRPLGYNDYFHYQVSEYGMNSREMLDLNRTMIRDVWPLYRELHTWARYELASRYGQPVPDMLPAHWLPNRWGQEWSAMVEVEGLDVDPALKLKSAEWIVKEGENFYTSLGFPALPQSFYEKSSLYPVEANAGYKKNTHASAWHMDNADDVRSLMSVQPNTEWWGTTLHELGHIYYYMTYTNPDVPIILRGGANRAYHEAMGSLIGMASMQKPFLEGRGLLAAGEGGEDMNALLKEALDFIVLIPWSAGVMTEFEHSLYADNLPKDQFNARWWQLKKTLQGIEPPSPRGEEYCDAATKTHINDDAAQYYDYAMSNVLLFQFHDYIANNILNQDPHATNYWGSRETGDFLKKLMKPGASVDWRTHLEENIGGPMSAKAMVDYFKPLADHLKEINKDRKYTLPPQPSF